MRFVGALAALLVACGGKAVIDGEDGGHGGGGTGGAGSGGTPMPSQPAPCNGALGMFFITVAGDGPDQLYQAAVSAQDGESVPDAQVTRHGDEGVEVRIRGSQTVGSTFGSIEIITIEEGAVARDDAFLLYESLAGEQYLAENTASLSVQNFGAPSELVAGEFRAIAVGLNGGESLGLEGHFAVCRHGDVNAP
jgi:hypothetical protein